MGLADQGHAAWGRESGAVQKPVGGGWQNGSERVLSVTNAVVMGSWGKGESDWVAGLAHGRGKEHLPQFQRICG